MRTRVGYCGGKKKNPTYENIGDHSETIQIDYDPTRITYRKLLELFWAHHNSCYQPSSRQYMSLILYHNDEQKKLAEETRDAEAARRKEKVITEVLPLGEFTLAEDYHQKYELREHREFLAVLTAAYPKAADLVNSTAAARLNAYLSGHGTVAELEKEIDSYGLPRELRSKLLELVGKK